ncbi:hypothetical protein VIBNISFn118_630079 [Vibrio nigripulchritudo SFn118]|nr:hypothetical protein VIBNISFn118_630079 [Vibrio nigripulchritudo SFn118]
MQELRFETLKLFGIAVRNQHAHNKLFKIDSQHVAFLPCVGFSV